jgi:hypothetical protein
MIPSHVHYLESKAPSFACFICYDSVIRHLGFYSILLGIHNRDFFPVQESICLPRLTAPHPDLG